MTFWNIYTKQDQLERISSWFVWIFLSSFSTSTPAIFRVKQVCLTLETIDTIFKPTSIYTRRENHTASGERNYVGKRTSNEWMEIAFCWWRIKCCLSLFSLNGFFFRCMLYTHINIHIYILLKVWYCIIYWNLIMVQNYVEFTWIDHWS